MAQAHKPTVGLTGGISSGKTTVARWLAELGAGWIDADGLAREVVLPGSPALEEIVASFGAEVLQPDGSLDRKKLGAVVFSDPEARQRLEAITHPRIAALSAARMQELQASDVPYIVYEAALLVEKGLYRSLDALIVVATSEAVQVARVMARDGLTEAEARQRIQAQLPLAQKLEVADYVIHNDGSLQQTRDQTEQVHARLLARFDHDGRGASH